MKRQTSLRIGVALWVAVACLAPLGASAEDDCTGAPSDVGGVLVAKQCWSAKQRHEFYFTSQGSQLMPYAWLLALDRPDSTERLLAPGAGLGRYGYLQDPSGDRSMNPDGLPIGFVKDPPPGTSDLPCAFVGLTCAACHTAQFQRAPESGKPHVLFVDGAPTSADMYAFLDELIRTLDQTATDPAKLAAFSARLPKEEQSGGVCRLEGLEKALAVRAQELAKVIDPGRCGKISRPVSKVAEGWGPARLDAVGVIINQIVLHLRLGDDGLRPVDAPVSYPFIWDAHQHNQVQWNGVADAPLVRNTVEVMGVFASFGPKVKGFKPFEYYDSSVRFDGLYTLEDRVEGLRSPRWPADFFESPLQEDLVAKGKEIFEDRCRTCHADVSRDRKVPHIQARMISLVQVGDEPPIGTDPTMAKNFAERTFSDPDEKAVENDKFPVSCDSSEVRMPQAETILRQAVPRMFGSSFSAVLTSIGEKVRSLWMPRTDPNRCAYKGRPLDGIWATAPYLHNGSVANLWDLLEPVAQRTPAFCVSKIQSIDPAVATYDRKRVGLTTRSSCRPGEFLLDTHLPGNANTGHEYFGADGAFTRKQIEALVEYQKSL